MQPTEKDQPLSRRERFDEWFRNDTKNADKLFWGGIAAVVTSWWIGSNTWDFLTWGWDTFHDPSIEIVKRLELTIQLVLGFAGFLIFYATLVRAWAAERTAEAGIETARAATQQAAIAEKNLVAERFSKDLELLDNNKSVHSRVGALYDLGHIMRTHGDDYHHSIVDLISSYLRVESQVHAQDGGIQLPLPKIFARDTRDIYDPVTGVVQSMKGRGAPPISILRSDILAAINVLRTRPGRENEPTLLLAGAVLPQADLREANLSKADLRRSNCEQAATCTL